MKLSQHLAFKKKEKEKNPQPKSSLSGSCLSEKPDHRGTAAEWTVWVWSQPRHVRVTAEVSLRLMIMNYAEGHIPLVTSHLHGLPLDCLAGFNFFFFLLWGNNSLNRCSKLNLLTFYFSSIMPSLQNNQMEKSKTPTLNEITAVTRLGFFLSFSLSRVLLSFKVWQGSLCLCLSVLSSVKLKRWFKGVCRGKEENTADAELCMSQSVG